MHGSLNKHTRLYPLNCDLAWVTQSKALLATGTPDLETWHHWLGHCDHQKILDMVCHSSVTGMPIDLSSSPPKCDSCILRKQMHLPVLKMHKGARANMVLQWVFVDLCGPMPGVSHTRNVYTMNFIDDFSSYVWCVLLKCKSDASTALQTWHRAVTTQSILTLKILVTDNGELVSASTSCWCDTYGIDHQCTVPYMSAQNGHAECLHCTLFGHTCAMHLACNAPISL